mmetsp:Transcript_109747/g.217956  ORF Transcript_109747/g.217956 Transcript_109747/m.217956 type:complete len:636 (-) Transcript_109747:92-1999(-)
MLGFHDQQQQQMQQMQMQGMMAMAAAGVPPVANTTAGIAAAPGGDVGVGVGFNNFMAGDMAQPTLLHQSTGADGSQAMLPPGADPAMAQVYAQMFSQYMQTAQAYAGMDPTNTVVDMGIPPVPFPQVPPASYSPPTPLTPAIAVSVDGMKFQYQLTEDDLRTVFSRYGAVQSIHVDEVGTGAQITFQEVHHAQAAMSDLNGKALKGLEGTLRLAWASSPSGPSPSLPPPFRGWTMPTPSGAAIDPCAALAGSGAFTMPQTGVDWNNLGAASVPAAWPGVVAASDSTPATRGVPLSGDGAGMMLMGCTGLEGASSLLGSEAAMAAGAAFAGPGACGSGSLISDGALHAAAAAAAAAATAPAAAARGGICSASSSNRLDAKAAAAPAHVKGIRKYTCRFLIGIENDKEFQVVRRIIGAKGTNMKQIVKQTDAKLRLRGIGSGYFEGTAQRESSEPLQLCVSCTSSDGYRTAVRLVEELLENVYNEYQHFCRENNRPEPDLHASPQLVSAGGRGGGGYGGAGDGAVALAGDSGSLSGGEGHSPSSKRDGRRRGRRSRAKKGDAGKSGAVERGDPPPKAPPIDEIEHMIDQRNEARRQCNFTEADRLRQSLHEKGVALMDEPGARGKGAEVTTWRYWRD